MSSFDRSNSGIFQKDSSVYSVFHGTQSFLLEDELNESQWTNIERLAEQVREQYTSGFLKAITAETNSYENFFSFKNSDLKTQSLFIDGYMLKIGMNDPSSLPPGLTPSDNKVIVKMTPAGASNRTDLVILEAWFEVIDHNEVLRKFGGVDTPALQNQILDTRNLIETSRRVQFKWRIRSIENTIDITTVNASKYNGVISNAPTAKYAALGGIYAADTGIQNVIGNLKAPGIVYGLPLFTVVRTANNNFVDISNITTIAPVSTNLISNVGLPLGDIATKTDISDINARIGTNTDLTTIARNTVVASINEINGLAQTIGNLTALTTTTKTTIVASINEVNGLALKIGNLTTLTTTNKTTIVASINEVNGLAQTIGSLSTLTTTAKNTVVASINEVNGLAKTVGALTALTTSNKTTIVASINEVNGVAQTIGSLATLTTTAKTTIVASINEVNGLAKTIGSLANLTTTDKTTIVASINEVNGVAQTIGNLTTLTTTAKTTSVDAINEVNRKIGSLINLNTTAKDNLVDAINEIKSGVGSGPAPSSSSEFGINIKNYGAIGDGVTNDTGALNDALVYLQSIGGGAIFFPKGTYNLATWNTTTVTYPLAIIGTEFSKIVAVQGTTSKTFLKLTSNFIIRDISIEGFYDVLDFTPVTTVIDYIKVDNVKFKNYKRAAVTWSETNLSGGVKSMRIERCTMMGETIIPGYGLALSTPIYEKLEIHGNTIDTIAERGIYIGSNNLALQDLRENANITRNNVGNIYNSYGSAVGQEDFNTPAGEGKRAADGIQVLAANAIISENYLYNVDNFCKQDCEGIYTKCKYAIIKDNHLVNAGGSEAFIDVKGSGRAASKLALCTTQSNVTTLIVSSVQYFVLNSTIDIFDQLDNVRYAGIKITAINTTNKSITISGAAISTLSTDYIVKGGRAKGYGTIIANNKILDNTPVDSNPRPGSVTTDNPAGDPNVSVGIKLNTDDIICQGNFVEGVTANAIAVGGSSYNNIQILGNKIRKIRGYGGISVGGTGSNFVVDNNQIIDITPGAATNTPYGISVGGQVLNTVVSNNQIFNVIAGVNSGSPCGVAIAPDTFLANGKNNISVRDNYINTTTRGIYFRAQPADDVLLAGNKIQNTTAAVYYGTVAPSGLIIGTNYPQLALPAPIDPTTISGLYSWFDAASIAGLADGASLATWFDKSVNSNNASQATVANQPIYMASGLNGKPAVSFSGTQTMKTAAYTTPMTQPDTIFIVASITVGYIFDSLATTGRQYLRSSGVYTFNSGISLSTGTSDSNFHLFTLKGNGVTSSIKVDTISRTGDAGVNALDGLTLGSLTNGTGQATGKICEMLVYNATLSTYQTSRIEDYLKNKWGLTF